MFLLLLLLLLLWLLLLLLLLTRTYNILYVIILVTYTSFFFFLLIGDLVGFLRWDVFVAVLSFTYKESSNIKATFQCILEVDHFNCNRYVFEQAFLSFFQSILFLINVQAYTTLCCVFCFRSLSSNICTFSAFSGRHKHQTNSARLWCDFCYSTIMLTNLHTTKSVIFRFVLEESSPIFLLCAIRMMNARFRAHITIYTTHKMKQNIHLTSIE